MVVQLLPRHMFTVDDYHRMVEAGILTEDDRVELLEGEIVEMPPIGSYHADVVDALMEMFAGVAKQFGFTARSQGPVALDENSEPQPDISLLRQRGRAYRDAHPSSSEILLAIEVADSTLVSDQRVKAPLYARNGISELWIVNLTNDSIEVFREPSLAGYGTRTIVRRGENLAPRALPSLVFDVDEIFG